MSRREFPERKYKFGDMQAPRYDESKFVHTGVVREPFTCYLFTKPYPFGRRTGVQLDAGHPTGPLTDFVESPYGDYVSALTELGHWLNIWCRFNQQGRAVPGGVFFVEVTAKRKGSGSSSSSSGAMVSSSGGCGDQCECSACPQEWLDQGWRCYACHRYRMLCYADPR